MNGLLLFASFAIILAGAFLFTNAIEWLGHRLNLGEGAVGSVLAAVGTAMPETLIPVVAIIGGTSGHEVAVGAIVGAPFLLATVAMALVGIAAISYVHRRPTGRRLDVHVETLDRDLLFFLGLFGIALLIGVLDTPAWVETAVGVGCVLAYIGYVALTIRGGGDVSENHELNPLIMDRRADRPSSDPPNGLIGLQLLIGLGAMVGGAHLFVHELIGIAASLGVSAIVLSLILAPLATELPEKANSYFWVREGKDSLALGNITGAMVFQSTIPVALGMIFIEWSLDRFAVVSMVLGLAGGVVAYLTLRVRGEFGKTPIAIWALLYAVFLGYVLVTGT